jgi:uncharacterized circularly permuted ATP-grasp superfamily protein
MCRKPEDLAYTLANLKDLVVKEVHGAGGYGMLVGPASTKAEIEDLPQGLEANPEKYIAQPTLALSSCPTFVESGVAPRHIDLRPYVLSGKRSATGAGRADPRRAERRIAGGKLVAGRGHQRHLDSGR